MCRNDDLDVALKSWWKNEDAQDTLSVAEECGFKYLLYMPGNTWANRMKYLMACGSTVIMPRDRYVAFWWHLLQVGSLPETILITCTFSSMTPGCVRHDVGKVPQQLAFTGG